MNAIRINSHEIIKPFGTESPPDPALLFQLPDEIRYGANLYGFQRTYEGTWSVDIYFDSASVTQKFSRKCSLVCRKRCMLKHASPRRIPLCRSSRLLSGL